MFINSAQAKEILGYRSNSAVIKLIHAGKLKDYSPRAGEFRHEARLDMAEVKAVSKELKKWRGQGLERIPTRHLSNRGDNGQEGETAFVLPEKEVRVKGLGRGNYPRKPKAAKLITLGSGEEQHPPAPMIGSLPVPGIVMRLERIESKLDALLKIWE